MASTSSLQLMDFCLPACDETPEPAAAWLPWSGLLTGENVEPQQLGQALSADTSVQLYPRPTDQQHPHKTLCQLPRTGTIISSI